MDARDAEQLTKQKPSATSVCLSRSILLSCAGSNDNVDFTRFRRHKSTSSLKLLERKRAHLVKMTVPADSIVKTFNVIKHV